MFELNPKEKDEEISVLTILTLLTMQIFNEAASA